MTSGAGRTYTWTYDNMPRTITNGALTTSFTYDYANRRVQKTGIATTTYVNSGYECVNGSCTLYIFAGKNRIAKIVGGQTSYFHTDHLNSTSIITDQSGIKVREAYYFPYGQTRVSSGTQDDKYKFTGQEEDDETGLYNYNARHYDPALGRFISADTVIPNYADPQSLNRYAYARNNPVIYVDPTGHFWEIIIGAVLGGLSAGYQSDWDGGQIILGVITGAVAGVVGSYAGSAASAFAGEFVGVVVGGAVGGAVGGGLNAAFYGTNIGDGMLLGAAGGALGFLAGCGLGVGIKGLPEPLRYAGTMIGGGLISGGLHELFGGNFADGFMIGAVGAVVSMTIRDAAKTMEGKEGQQNQYDKLNNKLAELGMEAIPAGNKGWHTDYSLKGEKFIHYKGYRFNQNGELVEHTGKLIKDVPKEARSALKYLINVKPKFFNFPAIPIFMFQWQINILEKGPLQLNNPYAHITIS